MKGLIFIKSRPIILYMTPSGNRQDFIKPYNVPNSSPAELSPLSQAVPLASSSAPVKEETKPESL